MSDERERRERTIAKVRLAKEAAGAKIGRAIHEASIDFFHETGMAITGISIYIPEVTANGDEGRTYVLGGVEIEVERI